MFRLNTPAPTELYTLSLHDALPIYLRQPRRPRRPEGSRGRASPAPACLAVTLEQRGQPPDDVGMCRLKVRPLRGIRLEIERSEEHTSELQSQSNLVCRLLLEKKQYT